MRPNTPRRPLVAVKLTNRWAVFDCDPDLQVQLKEVYAFHPPGYEFAESYRNKSWDGYISLMRRGRVGTGLFLLKLDELRANFQPQIQDMRRAPRFRNISFDAQVRPYQRRAIEAMIQAANTGGLILSATGSGKTWTVAEFFRRLVGTAIFIVDELTLLKQAQEELETALKEKVGIVGKSEFEPRRITVGTIQTLFLHKHDGSFRPWFRSVSVLVIDEIHTAINRRNHEIVNRIRPKAVYGLTATLQIEKPHILYPVTALAGPVLFSYPVRQGIEEGYLSDGVIVPLQFNDPLKGIAPSYWSDARDDEGRRILIRAGTPAAEYHYHVALNRVRNDCITQLARAGVQRGMHVVVLAEHRVHLKVLSKRLADITHQVISGARKQAERVTAMRAMDAGTLPLIIANRVFAKGVNIRSIDLIIDATGMPGRNGTLQRFGRGTRKADGKKGLVYIDISDIGSKFADTARSRLRALNETGCPIVKLTWQAGTASAVLDSAVTELTKGGKRKAGRRKELETDGPPTRWGYTGRNGVAAALRP